MMKWRKTTSNGFGTDEKKETKRLRRVSKNYDHDQKVELDRTPATSSSELPTIGKGLWNKKASRRRKHLVRTMVSTKHRLGGRCHKVSITHDTYHDVCGTWQQGQVKKRDA